MISVIIPLYNQQKFIGETLDSLVQQSFEEFEVIVVDDGSTDHSFNIACRYSEQLNLKIIKQRNLGVSSARNKGISASVGQYLLFLDADDILHPMALESISLVTGNNPDFIGFGYDSFKVNPSIENKKATFVDVIKEDFISDYFLKKTVLCIGSFLVSRELIENEKLSFTENISYSEDQKFIIESLLFSKKIVHANMNLLFYRTNENSVMHKKVSLKRITSLDGMRDLSRLVSKDFVIYKHLFSFYFFTMFAGIHNEVARKDAEDERELYLYLRKYRYILMQQKTSIMIKRPVYIAVWLSLILSSHFYVTVFRKIESIFKG